jgi:hypothetical protein
VRAPRAAAGGSGNEPPSGFRAGDRLMCRVLEAVPGGYSVTILKANQPGRLKTNLKIELDAEVEAQFVCVHRKQFLLVPIYSQIRQLNWSEEIVISEET